jgi:hypothetical protein
MTDAPSGDGLGGATTERVKIEDPARVLPELARWIRGQYHMKKWQRLELRHLSPGGADHVETWDEFEGVSPDQVLRNVYVAASDDARNFKGNQRYGVFFFEEGRNAPMRKLFWVKGAEWDEDDGFGAESEPANAKGLMSSLMRYNNDIMRVALTGAREQSHIMQRLLGDQMQQNEKLMGMHFQVLELHERLLDKTHERDMKREDDKSTREIKKTVTTLLANQGVQLLPLLLSKFAGAGAAPPMEPPPQMPPGEPPPTQIAQAPTSPVGDDKGDKAMHLLKTFAGSLSEAQIMKLMEELSDEQRRTFIDLYGTLLTQEQQGGATAPTEPSNDTSSKET